MPLLCASSGLAIEDDEPAAPTFQFANAAVRSRSASGWSSFEMEVECDRGGGGGSADLSELDVVLVRAAAGGASGGGDWACRLLGSLPALAVVVWREREESGGKRQVRLQLALRSTALRPIAERGGPAADAAAASRPRRVQLQKLGQCTSSWREWLVLHRLEASSTSAGGRGAVRPELLAPLLSGVPSKPTTKPDPNGARRVGAHGGQWGWHEKWQRLVKSVCECERLDQDQRSVLRETSDLVHHARSGFSLVQGPPGTGKTTLLRALLNVLHNAATQEYYERILNAVNANAAARKAGSSGGGGSAGGSDLLGRITSGLDRTSAKQGHTVVRRGGILVCAQSNAAIDELVARLLREKFVDEFGQRYDADLVRIGHQPAEAVKVVSLKQRAAQLASSAMGRTEPTADGGGGTARTPAEHEARKQQLAAQRTQCEREQRERAAARLVALARLDEISAQIDAAESRGQSAAAEGLVQHYSQRASEEAGISQRVVALQLEMDSIDSTLRSMSCVDGCLRPASRPPSAADSAAGGRATPPPPAAKLGQREIRQLEREVMDGAHIVFCTLSGAGEAHRLAELMEFETVIFDEAAQAGELATLIPLQYGARRVILVGDPQQLPATVVSLEAKRRGYATSLFERLQRGGHPPRMLRTQYRMHPAIRHWPSSHFYGGALRDGERVLTAARSPAGASDGAPGFLALRGCELRLAPYCFLNLRDGATSRGGGGGSDGHSLRNDAEAKYCVRLLLGLVYASDAWAMEAAAAAERRRQQLGSDDAVAVDGAAAADVGGGGTAGAAGGGWCCCRGPGVNCAFGGVCGRVALLTPYQAQKRAIEAELAAVFGGRSWEHAIEVASVDAFQGKEKDVIMYSSVRSGRGGLGFVKDLRRLNVALTRARHALYVIGSEASLRQSVDWRALLDDAAARGLSRDVTLEGALRVPPNELLRLAIPASLNDGTLVPDGDHALAEPVEGAGAPVELERDDPCEVEEGELIE